MITYGKVRIRKSPDLFLSCAGGCFIKAYSLITGYLETYELKVPYVDDN